MGRPFPTTRRQILKGGGALIIGFSLAGRIEVAAAQGSRIGKPLALTEVDSFLAIDDKSNCTVYSGKVDLGIRFREGTADASSIRIDEALVERLADTAQGLAARFFGAFEASFERLRSAYLSVLEWGLHHRKAVFGVFLSIVASGALLVPHVGEDFFPIVDAGQFRLHVRTPAGTPSRIPSSRSP